MKNKSIIYLGVLILAAGFGFASYAQMAQPNKTSANASYELCGSQIPSKISKEEDFKDEQCSSAINLSKNPYNIKTIYFGTNDDRDYCGTAGCTGFMWAQKNDGSLKSIGLGYNLYEVKYSGTKNSMPFFTIGYREANGINAVYKKIYFDPKTKTYK